MMEGRCFDCEVKLEIFNGDSVNEVRRANRFVYVANLNMQ